MVRPCHLSIQQNTCLWGRLNINENTRTAGKSISFDLPMESCEESTLRLLNEVFYPRLKSEPFELACDELVARHHR